MRAGPAFSGIWRLSCRYDGTQQRDARSPEQAHLRGEVG
jgi:hypothetical protein